MSSFYSFTPKTTTVSFSWPKELTGIERVALSAQGDLQRILSAFFARPIVLALIYSHTFVKREDSSLVPLSLPNPSAVAQASFEAPLVQKRQVHLQCGGKVVCVATSQVKISSARCAHLFIEEKYGIGQLFSKLDVSPSFELLSVGIGNQDDNLLTVEKGLGQGPQLWRKYKLSIPEFECEILEVFSSRDMFARGQTWLDDQSTIDSPSLLTRPSTAFPWLALIALVIFEFYAQIDLITKFGSFTFMSRLLLGPRCSRLFVPCLRPRQPDIRGLHGTQLLRQPQRRSRQANEKPTAIPQQPSHASSPDVYEEPDLRTPNSSRKAAIFTVLGSVGVYFWASARTNAKTDAAVTQLRQERGGGYIDSIDSLVLMRQRAYELKESLEKGFVKLSRAVQAFAPIPQSAILQSYAYIATKWLNAVDAQKVCWGICAANVAVFIAWKSHTLLPFMMHNFIHRPLSGRTRTLLTSVFSHHSFVHLFFNCYALHGFGAATGLYLLQQQRDGPSNLLESTTGYHFLAFFVSAGLFSSFASHALRLRAYDLIKGRLTGPARSAAKFIVGGSLGSSGAIYSCVAVAALALPQLHVNVMFIPIDIPIRTAVGGLVLMDIVGLLRGWRTFDHIAHLSGALFGLVYYMYGPRIWDTYRAVSARLFSQKKRIAVTS
ncbi:Rhomboid domain-containing protein [Mycena indigotica]|uniref:Rhomboid domain-containing protein n=1 Tax=Mycena indigotica TaxID=2126181 RepID=A0A8H6T4K3_9AGAR|nr:Rhomboid domain-containing protein [Mycena indigotica]KAF7309792.1 Rhomboid domain-containing protein [Mycena indigotica]